VSKKGGRVLIFGNQEFLGFLIRILFFQQFFLILFFGIDLKSFQTDFLKKNFICLHLSLAIFSKRLSGRAYPLLQFVRD